MSRTPLFALMKRSLRAAHAANETKVPLDELLEQRISRRRFLASTAAATVLASCRTIAPAAKEPDVIIAGAGIAGLTAGYRLARAGVAVRIYDGQYRTGGRMLSLRKFFPDGQVASNVSALTGGSAADDSNARVEARRDGLNLRCFYSSQRSSR